METLQKTLHSVDADCICEYLGCKPICVMKVNVGVKGASLATLTDLDF